MTQAGSVAGPATVDISAFRAVMSHFPTGVVVLTSTTENGPVGMTCQSFVSLSIDPPLVLICPAQSSTTWPRIEQAGAFVVNVLAEGQRAVSASFARSGTDKFAGHPWHTNDHGLPLLDEAIARIECRIQSSYPGGDHHVVVASVEAMEIGSDSAEPKPLVFFRSRYSGLGQQID